MAISKENTRIQVTIPKDLKKQLEEKAKLENRSVSNYIVTLIQKDLVNSSPPKEDGDFLTKLVKFQTTFSLAIIHIHFIEGSILSYVYMSI